MWCYLRIINHDNNVTLHTIYYPSNHFASDSTCFDEVSFCHFDILFCYGNEKVSVVQNVIEPKSSMSFSFYFLNGRRENQANKEAREKQKNSRFHKKSRRQGKNQILYFIFIYYHVTKTFLYRKLTKVQYHNKLFNLILI